MTRVLYLARIERRYDGARATIDVYATDAKDARRQAERSLDPGQKLLGVARWNGSPGTRAWTTVSPL
jgi:hypothetical protein